MANPSIMSGLRRDYSLGSLNRNDLAPNPLEQFQLWFDQAMFLSAGGRFRAVATGFYKWLLMVFGGRPVDVSAMTLATADKNGCPSARTVLLKGVDARGFVFFTQYESRKGQELAENPRAALNFYWHYLERQVCVTGDVTRLPSEESEAYFKTRPKGSRLAAWVSRQSTVVSNRSCLEEKFAQLQAQYPRNDIPMPPHWGGYLLAPFRIEFWQGRPNRLHDRFCYTREPDNSWKLERLSP